MGLIRVWLAIAVVCDHNGIRTTGIEGHAAVLFFFIISGFFMALVLNEKYETGFLNFYLARYLKLWPSYALVLVLVLIFLRPIGNVGNHSIAAMVYTYFVSATMLLYETLWWIGFDKASGTVVLFPTTAAVSDATSLAWFTSMAHMWSVGIELTFYLAAPFVARNPKRIVVALLLSYSAHVLIASNFADTDPFRSRNSLNVFWLFLTGMLSYWFWRDRYSLLPVLPKSIYGAIPVISLVVTVCLFVIAQMGTAFSESALFADIGFAGFALVIGPIFFWTRKHKIDGKLAVLSYPIYLIHWPIVYILIRDHRGDVFWTVLIIASSLVGAIALHQLVDKPIDRFRKRLSDKRSMTVRPAMAEPQIGMLIFGKQD